MKIHIVAPNDGWILEKVSKHYQEQWKCTRSTIPRLDSDINFYINYALFKKKTNKIDVGWFTHKEKKDIYGFERIAKEVDHCIAMSKKTGNLLPSNKTSIVLPGIDSKFYKESLIIGCVGREYKISDRKKFHLIEKLKKIDRRIKIKFTNGEIEESQMPQFYDSIDYLLILSENEGGPFPVLEALGKKKPIIAPDVGWCWDFPVLRYNNYDDLVVIFKKILLLGLTWEESAIRLYEIFEGLYVKNERNK